MQLRLHTRYLNSAGQRVRIVLNLKGVAYDYVRAASLSSQEYDAINPQRLLPALEIDGRFVPQSMAIVELIEELFPEPSVFPKDPILRAEVRAFSHHISCDLHPIHVHRVRTYLAEAMGVDDARIKRWYEHWTATAFASLEQHLARRTRPTRYCFTDEEPTLADATLVPAIDNARRFGCDLGPYPLLVAADAECRKLDAVLRAAPEMQPDFPKPGA